MPLTIASLLFKQRAHDSLRQAARALIPENKRESFHLLIGTRMLMNTPESELDTTIFYILGHMNKGEVGKQYWCH
jgi:predicted ATPase